MRERAFSMKIKKSTLVYGLLIIIFSLKRFWGSNLPWFVQPVIAILAIFIAHTYSVNSTCQINYRKHIYLAVAPIVCILGYSLIIWMADPDIYSTVVSNGVSSSVYLVLAILMAAAVYRVLGERIIDFTFKCFVISYCLGSILGLFLKCGFTEGFRYLFTLNSEVSSAGYIMEVHDITFAFGIFFIYYLFFDYEDRNRLRKIILCSLMIIWGLKRIEIAALIIVSIVFVVFIKRNVIFEGLRFISTIVALVVSYVYVFFIHSSKLIELATMYGIDFSGRLDTYSYIASNYSKFSLFFWGKGIGFLDEEISRLQDLGLKMGDHLIISTHSDILRMYVSLGFIGFGIWMWYLLSYRTKKIESYYGLNNAKLYYLCTIYYFVLFLTDNTYSYQVTLLAFIVVLLGSLKSEEDIAMKT